MTTNGQRDDHNGGAGEALPILVSEPEAAALLGVSRRKLFDLRKRGVVEARLIDRRVLYSVRSLERWVEDGCPLDAHNGSEAV